MLTVPPHHADDDVPPQPLLCACGLIARCEKEAHMTTIMVPLDGSPLAEHALPQARTMARSLEAQVHLLRVVPEPVAEPVLVEAIPALSRLELLPQEQHARQQASTREACAHAEGYLFSQAARLRGLGLQATTEVCMGRAGEEIVAAAQESRARMIVMATHGRSGLRRWTLGSVADKVVRTSHTPVLLVRATGDIMREWNIRRIVVPLDGSYEAQQALPLAGELAERTGAALLFVRVLTPMIDLDIGWGTGWGTTAPDYDVQQRTSAKKELQILASEYRAQGLHITPVVTFGYPAEEIITTATRHNADLIVMATHGYSGMQRLVLGSVADKVLHAATTPLLLVRPTVV
jgi:nucleotide-binding universal stress UspA family protein